MGTYTMYQLQVQYRNCNYSWQTPSQARDFEIMICLIHQAFVTAWALIFGLHSPAFAVNHPGMAKWCPSNLDSHEAVSPVAPFTNMV